LTTEGLSFLTSPTKEKEAGSGDLILGNLVLHPEKRTRSITIAGNQIEVMEKLRWIEKSELD
jgi:hypothetical protein